MALLHKAHIGGLLSNIISKWISLFLKFIAQPIGLPIMDPWLAQTIFPFGFILRIGGMISQKENKVRIKSTLIQLFNDQSSILSLFK